MDERLREHKDPFNDDLPNVVSMLYHLMSLERNSDIRLKVTLFEDI